MEEVVLRYSSVALFNRNMSHLCIKFSSSHIKKVKRNEINIFYLSQFIKNIIITFTFLKNWVFEIQCVFHALSTSQFGLATIQVLSGYVWLVTALLA